MHLKDKAYFKWLTLFTSSSTLICCALPILFVSLGFGAVIASLNSHIPGLIFLAEHKSWTLTLSAIMLLIMVWIIWRPQQACPSDPELKAHCLKTKHWNQWIFFISASIWLVGFFFSVLLIPLAQLLN